MTTVNGKIDELVPFIKFIEQYTGADLSTLEKAAQSLKRIELKAVATMAGKDIEIDINIV